VLSSESFRVVGENVPRKEGLAKVTGTALYADDLWFEDCLHGRTVRANVPRGRIRGLRLRDGIPWNEFTIALPSDIPGQNVVTLIETDQPLLADREIHHAAEPLALIAHRDKELVERALHYVEVDVEEWPAILSIEDALRENQIFKSYEVQNSDPAEKWPVADLILEEAYRTGAQEHLYIEPQAMIAQAVPGRHVTIWGSMQCPYYVQKAVAPVFGLDAKQIRVIQTETGGGFGGKEEYPNMIAGHAALLSWKAGGRPVKMIYDRREDMWATTKRHPSVTRIKAAFTREGRLLALDIDITLDGGAYVTLSPVVLSRALLHSFGPYKCDHVRARGRVVMTNSVPYGAFRGFGAPQSIFAIELHMTRAAHELGIDPAEIRRRNFLKCGDRMPTGQPIKEEIALGQMLDRALERSNYVTRREQFQTFNRAHMDRRKGIGLSFFFHGSGFTGSGEARLGSEVRLRLTEEGGVEVLASNVEYGQGTNTVLSQIAAQALGISPQWVTVHQPDTDAVPDSGPTVASRTTMITGKLVQRAAQMVRHRLIESGYLQEGREANHFQAAVQAYLKSEGQLCVSTVHESPPDIRWNDETFSGDAYAAYSWSCDVAEIELDLVDYAARVANFTSVVECGQLINPALARGQIEGGIAQGIGLALYENVVLEGGAMKNNQYTNYIVPTAADAPDIDVEFVQFPPTNHGPFHAKGIGEMPIDGPAPAIASAVANALGHRFINELPLLPERIMNALGPTEAPLAFQGAAPFTVSPRTSSPLPRLATVEIIVNGEVHKITASPMKRLLDVLRNDLRLTGTKEGCGEGECGACAAIVNGLLVQTCLVPICQASGAQVLTIEGLVGTKELHPIQEAFCEKGGAQCGICTPGMILSGLYYLEHPQDAENAREALSGNQCRCTGYTGILHSIQTAEERMKRKAIQHDPG
jgi:CO/xanthine dehydrogenase Mo-binding subunit/aerobic-type carbon monoxide dehydrogenase small subunit (CoxS/CutS family)